MFVVIAMISWAILVGCRTKRYGIFEQALLLAGIIVAMTIQYFVLGLS